MGGSLEEGWYVNVYSDGQVNHVTLQERRVFNTCVFACVYLLEHVSQQW